MHDSWMETGLPASGHPKATKHFSWLPEGSLPDRHFRPFTVAHRQLKETLCPLKALQTRYPHNAVAEVWTPMGGEELCTDRFRVSMSSFWPFPQSISQCLATRNSFCLSLHHTVEWYPELSVWWKPTAWLFEHKNNFGRNHEYNLFVIECVYENDFQRA